MNQETQDTFGDFVAVLKELSVLAGEIAEVEEGKAEAASTKRHERLDHYIQKEQAQILKLRGLEQHRIRLSKDLGWDSLTFRQILDRADESQREALLPLFDALTQQLKRLQQSRKSAESIIQVRIHELQTAIAAHQGSSYDNAGNINLGASARPKIRDTYV